MKLAIIADDNTGATDAAGMLTSKGVKVLLVIDHMQLNNSSLLNRFDAIVVATRIRSTTPKEAYERTAFVIEKMKKMGVEKIQLKYCSTFDSTKEGNIGQSLDAAHDSLQFSSTIVCPSLPVNGRTTYLGYLFVNGTILNESPLRNHPLNPMTDSNLVRWLSYQTKNKVGLIPWNVIHAGTEAIRNKRQELENAGILYHVSDAIVQEDIDAVVSVYSDMNFLSGGSGVSESIAKEFFTKTSTLDFSSKVSTSKNLVVVISGSESPTTAKQRKHALDQGFVEIPVHPISILDGVASVEVIASQAAFEYRNGKNVIIALDRTNGGDVASVDLHAVKFGYDRFAVGERLGMFLGKIANCLVREYNLGRLVVAGGETSGAVCEACGFGALEIGLPIDPGVPYCFPSEFPNMLLVLKSGNFGRESLYIDVANFSMQ